MDASRLLERAAGRWELPATGAIRVRVLAQASAALLADIADRALAQAQAVNVAALPGIVGALHMMPDAHGGYGFPIGGVAAFDARAGGVVSAGGVGFDISCAAAGASRPIWPASRRAARCCTRIRPACRRRSAGSRDGPRR